MSGETPRPDIYAILHRKIGKDAAAVLSTQIEVALGWKPRPIEWDAVAAALQAYREVVGSEPRWDGDNGPQLWELIRDATRAGEVLGEFTTGANHE